MPDLGSYGISGMAVPPTAPVNSGGVVANGGLLTAERSATIRRCSRLSAPPLLVLLVDSFWHLARPV